MLLRAALLFVLSAIPADALVVGAFYDEPTTRYPHGVLGDPIEWGALVMELEDDRSVRVRLPASRVFEDLRPRLADLDRDGTFEVIVVESDISRGSRLAIYDERGQIAATPFLGETNRWLAPVGVADLNADGFPEIAYVETPHIAPVLKVWRYRNGTLEFLAESDYDGRGLTNHRIGNDFIEGGIANCGLGPVIYTATGDWSQIVATAIGDNELLSQPVALYGGPGSIERFLVCPTTE